MSRLVRRCIYAGVVALATLATAAPAGGAPRGKQTGMRWQGSGGWGEQSGYQRLYDPKTVVTVRGQVAEVGPVRPARGMSRGVQIMLRTDIGLVPVHLGPEWYVGRQDVRIKPKDTIEVTGSRATIAGRDAILASQVVKGESILVLRDNTGLPMWAWGRAPAAAAAKP